MGDETTAITTGARSKRLPSLLINDTDASGNFVLNRACNISPKAALRSLVNTINRQGPI